MKKLIVLLLLSFCVLDAQEAIYIGKDKDNSSEAESETIGKRIRELGSESAETRRTAVLILGKYDSPEAIAALIGRLEDNDVNVRRSALVSLVENMMVPGNAAIPILNMIADSDVHIRRIASAAIPNLAIYLRGGIFNQQSAARLSEPNIPEKTRQALRKGFSDEDSGVRKNMATYFSSISQYVAPDELIPLLDDPESEIKILAIENVLRHLSTEKLNSSIIKLSKDKDKLVRLKVVQNLKFMKESPLLVETLWKLLDDEYKPVRAEALAGLLIFGKIKDLKAIDRIISDPETDIQSGRMIVSFLPSLGPSAIPLLKKIADEGNPSLRASALNSYLSMDRGNVRIGDLMKYLEDASPEIRGIAASYLSRQENIDDVAMGKLLGNKNTDVRMALVNSAWSLPEEKAAKLLDELLIDESDEIRKSAISVISRRKISGYMGVLESTLSDENQEISANAVNELIMMNSQESQEVLRKFLDLNKDHPMAATIRNYMGRKQPKNNPPIRLGPARNHSIPSK